MIKKKVKYVKFGILINMFDLESFKERVNMKVENVFYDYLK